ncbi:hypothetical protein V7200_18885 [Cytobacillus firmus]|uniref:Penicillin acylase II n=1 Tax=Cytobacillus firmus TaxID=1399 RepID=A0A800MV55_CYTFI|nr:Penicillin acylase II [Cytobacillus firmus]
MEEILLWSITMILVLLAAAFFIANGKVPIRKKGDGLLPVPGWSDE